jgi:hypothetical protein
MLRLHRTLHQQEEDAKEQFEGLVHILTKQIRNILTTVEGQQDVSYKENVLHGWV